MSFTARLELPPDIEQRLRKENPDISKEVQEAFVLELFRRIRRSLTLKDLEGDYSAGRCG